MSVIEITNDTFDVVSQKLQEEFIEIIENNIEVNDYQLITYKYVFISELEIPLWEDLGIEIAEDSFVLYIVPDDLKLSLLEKLDDAFDRFEATFMPNAYNVLKIKFCLSD